MSPNGLYFKYFHGHYAVSLRRCYPWQRHGKVRIEKVFEEMSTDVDGNEKQAEIMEQEYMDATEDQKKAIDRVFIALCGWSLKTLIEGYEATESYNPYK